MNAHRGSKRQLKGMGAGVYRMDALKSLAPSDTHNKHNRNVSDSITARDVAGFSMNDEEDDVYDVKTGGRSMSSSSVTYLEEVVSDEEDERIGDINNNRGYNKKKVNSMKKDLDDSVNKWLGSKESKVLERCPTDGKAVLEGFTLASLTQKMQQVSFISPQAPKDFKPGHLFIKDIDKTGNRILGDAEGQRKDNGNDAVHADESIVLSKQPQPQTAAMSVFDMISEDSKRKIQSAIDGRKALAPVEAVAIKSLTGSRPMLTSDAALKSTFAGLAQAFQNRFVSSSSATPTDATIVTPGMGTAAEYASATSAVCTTSDQDEKKVAEKNADNPRSQIIPGSTASFLRNNSMNSLPKQEVLNRYVSAGSFLPVNQKVAASAVSEGLLSSVASGLPVKTHTSLKGKSSRTTTPWYPVPLLSRRFHIKVDGVNIGMKNGRLQQGEVNRVVDSKLEGMFAGLREPTNDVIQNQDHNQNLNLIDVTNDTLHLDMYEEQVQVVEEMTVKPAMSLFKSIFEDSDSDEDSESDNEIEVEVEVEVLTTGKMKPNINEDEMKVTARVSKESTVLVPSSSTGQVKEKGTEVKEKGTEVKEKGTEVNRKDTAQTGVEFLRHRFASQIKDSIAPTVTVADSDPLQSFTGRKPAVVAAPVKAVIEEEDEDAGARVVFRKPVVKAKVNMFSSTKPKRTFTAMSRDDEDGDGAGENDDTDAVVSAVVKSKKKMLRQPGIITSLKAVTPSIEKASEVQRLLKEMEEGTIEEAERKAANVSATAYFLNCITESSKSDVIAQIAAAEAAAADIIALAEEESERKSESQTISENFTFNPEPDTDESKLVSSWYAKSDELLREKNVQAQATLEEVQMIDMTYEKDKSKMGKRKHKKEKKEEKNKKHSHHSHSDNNVSDMKKSKEKKSKKEKEKKKEKKEPDIAERNRSDSNSGSGSD